MPRLFHVLSAHRLSAVLGSLRPHLLRTVRPVCSCHQGRIPLFGSTSRPAVIGPVPLDGLAERIEQIARMRVEEAVQIRTTEIESTTRPASAGRRAAPV